MGEKKKRGNRRVSLQGAILNSQVSKGKEHRPLQKTQVQSERAHNMVNETNESRCRGMQSFRTPERRRFCFQRSGDERWGIIAKNGESEWHWTQEQP